MTELSSRERSALWTARIDCVLNAHDGLSHREIAQRVGVTRDAVYYWAKQRRKGLPLGSPGRAAQAAILNFLEDEDR